MISLLDAIVIALFVLFLVYIFRGYHLSRLKKEEQHERRDVDRTETDDSCSDGGE